MFSPLRAPHSAFYTFKCDLLFGLWFFSFFFSCSLPRCFSFIYLFSKDMKNTTWSNVVWERVTSKQNKTTQTKCIDRYQFCFKFKLNWGQESQPKIWKRKLQTSLSTLRINPIISRTTNLQHCYMEIFSFAITSGGPNLPPKRWTAHSS
jgi:hypothetical protein